jgi:hypothetical protein
VYYNENMNSNSNFKHNYFENYNDSEVAVKAKNAPFFMIFSNILLLYRGFSEWTGPLKSTKMQFLDWYNLYGMVDYR